MGMRYKTKFLNKTRKPKYGQVMPHVVSSEILRKKRKHSNMAKPTYSGGDSYELDQ